MTTDSTPEQIPLGPRDEAYRAATIERYMSNVGRFVGNPVGTPAGLRRPYSYGAFLKLPTEVRQEVILGNVTARVDREQQAFLRRVQARRDERERLKALRTVTAPAPVEPTASPEAVSRYVVPCAGGCGTMLPARSARPVVKFCSPHVAQTTRTSRRRSPLDDSIREVVAKPSRSVYRPATPNKTKKHRRRAICASTAAHP